MNSMKHVVLYMQQNWLCLIWWTGEFLAITYITVILWQWKNFDKLIAFPDF